VEWVAIADRLTPERSYWLSTVGRNGAPHVTPVWGVVVEQTWHCYSERHTVKARNLQLNPRVAVHLGDGDDVVIVHGSVVELGRPQARPDVIAAFDAKYTRPDDVPFLPSADPDFDVLYALEPTSAMVWRLEDYEGSQQRWHAT
jgi:general stress protein 26